MRKGNDFFTPEMDRQLRALRMKRGLSLSEVARRLGQLDEEAAEKVKALVIRRHAVLNGR